MRIWILLLLSLTIVGCGSSGNGNIVEDANAQKLREYEEALAEADRMAAGDKEVEQ